MIINSNVTPPLYPFSKQQVIGTLNKFIGNSSGIETASASYICYLLDENGARLSLQLSALNKLRYYVKFLKSSNSSTAPTIIGPASGQNAGIPQIFITSSGRIRCELLTNSTTVGGFEIPTILSNNQWYYIDMIWENQTLSMYLYDNNKNLVDSNSKYYSYISTYSLNVMVGGKTDSYFKYDIGKINLSESYIEKDDVVIWQWK